MAAQENELVTLNPDREKVIKGLECCAADCVDGCPYENIEAEGWNCTTLLCRDALELLKAQEPIVYCHECRFYNDTGCAKGFGWCERNGNGHGSVDEWYCADGERRKNDD